MENHRRRARRQPVSPRLAKYEFKVSGKVTFNGNDRDVERTTTVEIKDIGSTRVDVPEAAKKKLS